MNEQTNAKVSNDHSLAGKYLTFVAGDEEYGIGILKVQEIIGIMKVTRVPRVSSFIRGVINLRGKVIPIIDLRLRFDLPAQVDSERTCIVVVQIRRDNEEVTMGIVVDEVREVMDIAADAIEPPPRFGNGVSTAFLLGMAKVGDKVIELLDIDRVLSQEEMGALQEVSSES
ncbi:MAG: purine-binding chemotaxis protein CheW [Planctomycetota bacterium]|nr:MAG: purine-binding chemotaxis protein CheW [Planctomycetota bacterium]